MNKKIKLILSMFMALFFVTGCGEKENYFEIAKEKMSKIKNYSMDVKFDIGVKTDGVSLEIPVNLDCDIDIENKLTKMVLSVNFMDNKVKTTTYADSNNDDYIIQYTSEDNENWIKSEKENKNKKDNSINIIDASDIELVNSKDDKYYIYEAVISKEKLMKSFGDINTEGVIDSIEIKDDIKFKYYINKKTKYVEKITGDLKEIANFTNNSEIEMELSKLDLEINLSNFNSIDKIKLPKNQTTKAESDTMVCNYEVKKDDYKLTGIYTVEYEDNYVTNVKTTEIIDSNNDSILQSFKTQISSTYSPYDELEYYNYDIELSDNVLTSTTNIDYTKIDMDKMTTIDSSIEKILVDGKININTMKAVYTTMGAKCTLK